MKQFFIFLVAFVLRSLLLPAQEWSVVYPSDHPQGYNHFHDAIVDEQGVVFLVGQEGLDSDNAEAVLFRVGPDGVHSSFKYRKNGYHSKAYCIVELPNHNLFVAGNIYDDSDDWLLVLVIDKDLHLLEERLYEKEVEGVSFGSCRGVPDAQGNIIVSTCVIQNNEYNGTYYRGAFYQFDPQGDTLGHRYLLEAEPNPVCYLNDFRVRQMWCKGQDETLLCLVPGYGGILSFITFDSLFNYIEEYPIWRDQTKRSDHTLFRDCYTDYWLSDDEALFFSSIGAADHNRLRVSRVTTQGEILELLPLNDRTDTIDDAARPRCMAAANDSTFYFSFHSHQRGYYPGNACVYQLNERLEIVGSHVDDDHESYRTGIVLPTHDGGCITVNDSCNYYSFVVTALPVVRKLTRDDFVQVPWSVSQSEKITFQGRAYPNPCQEMLHIPMPEMGGTERIRCRVESLQGHVVLDCIVQPHGNLLNLDVSRLKSGIYYYRIYSDQQTLFSNRFVKK